MYSGVGKARLAYRAVANALYAETLSVTQDVCTVLRQVDPGAFHHDREAEVRTRVDRIVARLRALVAVGEGADPVVPTPAVRDRLRGLLAAVERAAPSKESTHRERWTVFQREVQPAYDSLAQSLRGVVGSLPTVRPTNVPRSLLHLTSAVMAVAMIRLLPQRSWLIAMGVAFAGSAWAMEALRRYSPAANERLMRVFALVAHAHERHRVNSGTWYATALLLLGIFSPRLATELGVIILGFADPAASLVGRRFGRTRLREGRSLEGSLAFVGAAMIAAMVVLLAFHPMPLGIALILAGAGAVVGAVTELYSGRLDDNFTVPVSVALIVGILATAMGVAA